MISATSALSPATIVNYSAARPRARSPCYVASHVPGARGGHRGPVVAASGAAGARDGAEPRGRGVPTRRIAGPRLPHWRGVGGAHEVAVLLALGGRRSRLLRPGPAHGHVHPRHVRPEWGLPHLQDPAHDPVALVLV